MRRRDFVKLIGGGLAAWPRLADAQHSVMPVIGYIGTGSRESDAFRLPFFRQGLSETGYVEGRNVLIEYRWAEWHNDRLPALAADLVSLTDDGPAATAGIVAGDIILTVDGASTRRVRNITARLGADSIGRKVDLRFIRSGTVTSRQATITERPSP